MTIKKFTRVLEISLITIQSVGIRFFDGQGIVLSVIIIFLLRNVLVRIGAKDRRILFIIIAYLILIKLFNKSFDLQSLLFQIVLVFTAYLFLKQYNDARDLIDDFYESLRILFYHAMIGYVFWMLIPNVFSEINVSGLRYKSFIHLFYVTDTNGDRTYRNTGICWEPGLLQLVLNLLLFFSIKNNKNLIFQFLIILTIITTGSTTGFLILGLNYIFFIIKNKNTLRGKIIILSFLISGSLFFSIVYSNVSGKFNKANTSGLARSRDFEIGIELIKEKPFFGHGKFSSGYLISKPYVQNLESRLFSKEYLEISGYMSGGYTNGLLGFIAWFGIPASLYIFILLFKNRFIQHSLYERALFFLIIILTCYSEPITYTSFFLLFPFSALVLKE